MNGAVTEYVEIYVAYAIDDERDIEVAYDDDPKRAASDALKDLNEQAVCWVQKVRIPIPEAFAIRVEDNELPVREFKGDAVPVHEAVEEEKADV